MKYVEPFGILKISNEIEKFDAQAFDLRLPYRGPLNIEANEFKPFNNNSPYFQITMDAWNAHRTLSNYPKPFNND